MHVGNVRAESYTRPMHQNGEVNGAQESRQESFGPECTPDPTQGDTLQNTDEQLDLSDEEVEILQKFSTRNLYR